MTGNEPVPTAFEVEAASVEEFLRLLEERERGGASVQGPRTIRRAVFVAQMLDQRGTSYGVPSVRRYVVAAFAYGPDLVSHTSTTSSAVELPEMSRRIGERQREAYEEMRAEIERGLEERGLDLPVYEGSLRHPVNAHGEGG